MIKRGVGRTYDETDTYTRHYHRVLPLEDGTRVLFDYEKTVRRAGGKRLPPTIKMTLQFDDPFRNVCQPLFKNDHPWRGATSLEIIDKHTCVKNGSTLYEGKAYVDAYALNPQLVWKMRETITDPEVKADLERRLLNLEGIKPPEKPKKQRKN